MCDKCLFEIERDVYSVKELMERWTIACEDDKCTQPAKFLLLYLAVPMLYVLCENILSNTL